MSSPTDIPDIPLRGTVYVVVQGATPDDVSGVLLYDSGEVVWQQTSVDLTALKRDLTTGFPSRESALEHRYPGGYDVRMAVAEGDVPAEVLERHADWYKSRTAGAELQPLAPGEGS